MECPYKVGKTYKLFAGDRQIYAVEELGSSWILVTTPPEVTRKEMLANIDCVDKAAPVIEITK